jgi:hypothetical protein
MELNVVKKRDDAKSQMVSFEKETIFTNSLSYQMGDDKDKDWILIRAKGLVCSHVGAPLLNIMLGISSMGRAFLRVLLAGCSFSSTKY